MLFPIKKQVLERRVAPVPWQHPCPGARGSDASASVTVQHGYVNQTVALRTK